MGWKDSIKLLLAAFAVFAAVTAFSIFMEIITERWFLGQ